MIIAGAMPAQHFSGVSHHRRRSRHADHDFAGAVSPRMGRTAWDNRNFLIRVTRFIASHAGIIQFLDCGLDYPLRRTLTRSPNESSRNVHVICRQRPCGALARSRRLEERSDPLQRC